MLRLRVSEVARRNKGWNMRQLADRLDVEHQTVLYWNQGRTLPRVPTLIRLMNLLKCDIRDLVHSDN